MINDEEDVQRLKEAALTYLDQTSQLSWLKERCAQYGDNKEVSLFEGICIRFVVDGHILTFYLKTSMLRKSSKFFTYTFLQKNIVFFISPLSTRNVRP